MTAEPIPPSWARIGSALQTVQGSLRLSPLEIASNAVFGRSDREREATWECVDGYSPLAALEAAVLPALLRPPCLVSFSGGMDSSFVLAVATRAARRHGLPPPIPITWRFTGAPRADETVTQEQILADLGIGERVTLRATEELDFVGPVATRLLRRYGVLYPGNLHFHLPVVEQAVGGSLLTGIGGDAVLNAWRRDQPSLYHRIRRRIPDTMRARWQQRDGHNPFPWLLPAVARDMLRRLMFEHRQCPTGAIDRLQWWTRARSLNMGCQNLAMIGRHGDVQVINPLLDTRFHAALGRSLGNETGRSRADVLGVIAEGEMPQSTVEYRRKANFSEVFLRSYTQDLVSTWDGEGVIASLVDSASLRAEWSPQPTSTATALLLQQVWAHQASRSTGW